MLGLVPIASLGAHIESIVLVVILPDWVYIFTYAILGALITAAVILIDEGIKRGW